MIKLHEKSEEYIKEVFDRYTELKKCPEIFRGKTIIHLYPTEDTMDSTGELDGFVDALFFEAKFYLTDLNVIYTTQYHDEVQIRIPADIRIFKDQSTMIIVWEDFKLLQGKSMLIIGIQNEYK